MRSGKEGGGGGEERRRKRRSKITEKDENLLGVNYVLDTLKITTLPNTLIQNAFLPPPPPNFTKEAPEAESLIIFTGSYNVLPSHPLFFSVLVRYSLTFSAGFLDGCFLYIPNALYSVVEGIKFLPTEGVSS